MSEQRFRVFSNWGEVGPPDIAVTGDGVPMVYALSGKHAWEEHDSLRIEWLPTERERKLEAALREIRAMHDDEGHQECDDPEGCPWQDNHRLIALIDKALDRKD